MGLRIGSHGQEEDGGLHFEAMVMEDGGGEVGGMDQGGGGGGGAGD